MGHLITAAMLDAATEALVGHGTRPEGETCICGYNATPVRRHLAELAANAIAPPLSTELTSVLAQVLPGVNPRPTPLSHGQVTDGLPLATPRQS